MAQSTARRTAPRSATPGPSVWALALGSIGVVYGDIGTSPCTRCARRLTAATKQGASGTMRAGILSLIVWTMLLIVTLKYVLVLLNADNKGEGGTFALMASASRWQTKSWLILVLGVVGAAFFYGDAVITRLSVLSAVEGLKLAARNRTRHAAGGRAGWLESAVLPITIVIWCCCLPCNRAEPASCRLLDR